MQQSLSRKETRKLLLAEINEAKKRVRWFDVKGNHDTCHHDDLKRLQAALKELNKRHRGDKEQESDDQSLEGDLKDGE